SPRPSGVPDGYQVYAAGSSRPSASSAFKLSMHNFDRLVKSGQAHARRIGGGGEPKRDEPGVAVETVEEGAHARKCLWERCMQEAGQTRQYADQEGRQGDRIPATAVVVGA